MTPLWTAAEAAAATGGGDTARLERERASRSTAAASRRAICSSRCAARTSTATISSPPRSRAAPPPRWSIATLADMRAERRCCVVGDTLAGARGAGPRGARPHARRASSPSPAASARPAPRRRCGSRLARRAATFASAGSLNNHWGVPLSLARMPPDAAYGVFELGMNHAGEIAALTRLVRPHVARHHHGRAGASRLFRLGRGDRRRQGRNLPRHRARRRRRAQPRQSALSRGSRPRPTAAGAASIIGFGDHPRSGGAARRLHDSSASGSTGRVLWSAADYCASGSIARPPLGDERLAVLARSWPPAAMSAPRPRRSPRSSRCRPRPPPRLPWRGGNADLIDESYNASPAAMRAALAVLGATTPAAGGRRIAVLGDMLELGAAAGRLHRELAEPLAAASVDLVFHRRRRDARARRRAADGAPRRVWPSAEAATPALLSLLQAGDVVTVKGSHGVRYEPHRRAFARRTRTASRPDAMLYALLSPLADQFHAFNLFRYITFRSGGAVVTALLISFVFGPPIIAWLQIEAGRRPADPHRRAGEPSRRARRARRRWAAS